MNHFAEISRQLLLGPGSAPSIFMIIRSSLILVMFPIFSGSCRKATDSNPNAIPTVFVKEVINLSVNHQDTFRIGRFGFPENNIDHSARLGDGMITGELWGDPFWISSENLGPITKFGAETFVNHDKISEVEIRNKIRSLVPGLGPNSRVIVARCGENIVIINRNQFSNDVALVIENKSDRFALVNFDRISDKNVERIFTYLGGLRILDE